VTSGFEFNLIKPGTSDSTHWRSRTRSDSRSKLYLHDHRARGL